MPPRKKRKVHHDLETKSKTETKTYVKGEKVLCMWSSGIWWPGYVSEARDGTYLIAFWNEEETLARKHDKIIQFNKDSARIATSLNKIKRMKRFDLEEKYLMDLDQIPPCSPETSQSTLTSIGNAQSNTNLTIPSEKHGVSNTFTVTSDTSDTSATALHISKTIHSAPSSEPSSSLLTDQHCMPGTSSTATVETSDATDTAVDIFSVEKPAEEIIMSPSSNAPSTDEHCMPGTSSTFTVETSDATDTAVDIFSVEKPAAEIIMSPSSNAPSTDQHCMPGTSSTFTVETSDATDTAVDIFSVEKPAAEIIMSPSSNAPSTDQHCMPCTSSTAKVETSDATDTALDIFSVEKPAAEIIMSPSSNAPSTDQHCMPCTSSTAKVETSDATHTALDIFSVEKPAAEETTETIMSASSNSPSNSTLTDQGCVPSISDTSVAEAMASDIILLERPDTHETVQSATTKTPSNSHVTELSDIEIADQEAMDSFDEDVCDDLEYRPTKSDLSYESDTEVDEEMIEEINCRKKKNRKKSNYKKQTSKMPVGGIKENASEDDAQKEHNMPTGGTKKTCHYVSDSDSSQSEVIPLYVPKSGPLSVKAIQYEDSEEEEDEIESDVEEDEIMRDVSNTSIYIRRILKSSTSKTGKKKKEDRIYNTRHCCPFCKKLVSSFCQHISSKKHESETDVKKITAAKDKERKRLILKLRNRGDNIHNESVLKSNKGEIILTRRCEEEEFDISKYGPCPRCFGWFRLTVLDRHKCCVNEESTIHITKGMLLMQSAVISGRVTEEASKSLLQEVFPIMTDDRVGKMAKKDSLIVALGNHWMRRNIGNKLMRRYYVSGVMRLVSRLLIQLQGMTNSSHSMENFIHPKFFTYVAKAALIVSRQDDDDEENLKAPSNAIKLSYDLKRLGNIKYVRAIMTSNAVKKLEAKEFLKLMELEWSTKLSRVILQERKLNKKYQLPLPEDVQKLSTFLRQELECFNSDDVTYENFRNGVILVEACLISYNRRRPGEIQALRLSVYENRKRGLDQVAEEVTRDLTEFERKLVEEQDVIEIRGKCGKVVPVLVPLHAQRVLRFLTDKTVRSSAGISSPYVFASKRGGVVRGYDALKKATETANLQRPELIRGTNMRRLMATLSQAIDISPQQQQWIVDHLGHTLNVHNIHYKCTSDVIERTDIAKLLLLMDTRQISKFKGEKLEDIQMDELVDSPSEEGFLEEEDGMEDEEESTPEFQVQEEESFEDHFPELPQEDNEFEAIPFEPRKKKKQKATATNRHKWSLEEIKEIQRLFAKWFKEDVTPGQQAIIKAKQLSKDNNGEIWKLDADKIKKKISWMRLHPKD